MNYLPEFSDDEEGFSDDPDYYDFLERIKKTKSQAQFVSESEESKRESKIKQLFTALAGNQRDSVLEILDNDLEVDVNLSNGWTPLLLSVSYGHYEIVQELLKRKANVNSVREGQTALMMACSCPGSTSSFDNTLNIIKVLVENGADTHAKNRKRMNALMFAACEGNLEAVKYLLPLSDRYAVDNQGWNVLFWAVSGNNLQVAHYLLEEGIDYTGTDIRTNNILEVAQHYEAFDILDLFPKEEEKIDIKCLQTLNLKFEEHFEHLKEKERPKFFLDIFNFLSGVKEESLFKIFVENKIGIDEFLCINEEDLKNLGVIMPFERKRILNGLHKFHKHVFSNTSLHIIGKKDQYTTDDIAKQILSCTKQMTVMETSFKYLRKNFNMNLQDEERKMMNEALRNIQKNQVKLMSSLDKLEKRAQYWDMWNKPADLITSKSRKYKVPKYKLITFIALISYITYKFWK